MTAAGGWHGRLLLVGAGLAVVVLVAVGCVAPPPPGTAIDRALEDNLGPGSIVDGVRTWDGLSPADTALDHTDGYGLAGRPRGPGGVLGRARQRRRGRPGHRLVDGHGARHGPPRRGPSRGSGSTAPWSRWPTRPWRSTFAGDTEPPESPDYPAPWCVIAIPRQGMAVIAHVLCTRPRPTGGYQVWPVRNEARFDLRPAALALEAEREASAAAPADE